MREEIESTVITISEDLKVFIDDLGCSRKIRIDGPHVVPGGSYNTSYSEMETKLSVATLRKIAQAKSKYFRDEIERSENPDYMYKVIEDICLSFNINLADKKILDFGCGAGAFSLNLLRLGAQNTTGVDIDRNLLDIAENRIEDFYEDRFKAIKIEYIDEESKLPFSNNSFDIVWAHAVLEHVFPQSRKYVLDELVRVLKKHGLLIIDATPNRLWVKECHTTGLYFLNYLPLNLACFLAQKFSVRVPKGQSAKTLLSRGIRGCTYREISKHLPDMVCLNNLDRMKDLDVFMRYWLHENNSPLTRNIKKTYSNFMRLIDPLLKIVKLPQTAFLPSLLLVFRKENNDK